MNQNLANTYQKNAILTASPAELTLMLYEGAIKFCNIALIGLEKKDYEKVHNNIMRAKDIITELQVTLDHKYPVWEDFDRVYDYILWQLREANIKKSATELEEALKRIREMRDTWKEVMRLAGESK